MDEEPLCGNAAWVMPLLLLLLVVVLVLVVLVLVLVVEVVVVFYMFNSILDCIDTICLYAFVLLLLLLLLLSYGYTIQFRRETLKKCLFVTMVHSQGRIKKFRSGRRGMRNRQFGKGVGGGGGLEKDTYTYALSTLTFI